MLQDTCPFSFYRVSTDVAPQFGAQDALSVLFDLTFM